MCRGARGARRVADYSRGGRSFKSLGRSWVLEPRVLLRLCTYLLFLRLHLREVKTFWEKLEVSAAAEGSLGTSLRSLCPALWVRKPTVRWKLLLAGAARHRVAMTTGAGPPGLAQRSVPMATTLCPEPEHGGWWARQTWPCASLLQGTLAALWMRSAVARTQTPPEEVEQPRRGAGKASSGEWLLCPPPGRLPKASLAARVLLFGEQSLWLGPSARDMASGFTKLRRNNCGEKSDLYLGERQEFGVIIQGQVESHRT